MTAHSEQLQLINKDWAVIFQSSCDREVFFDFSHCRALFLFKYCASTMRSLLVGGKRIFCLRWPVPSLITIDNKWKLQQQFLEDIVALSLHSENWIISSSKTKFPSSWNVEATTKVFASFWEKKTEITAVKSDYPFSIILETWTYYNDELWSTGLRILYDASKL